MTHTGGSPLLDIDTITAQDAPGFAGVTFDSKPAALRQLLIVKEIVEAFPALDGLIGLDIGSKFADLSTMLRAYGIRTVRLDTERRESSDEFLVADGERMPFSTACFDFGVLAHVMAHVDNIESLLSEAGRIIRPGGKLFILQANRFGWWKFWGYYLRRNDRRSHRRTFALWDIRNALARHGFRIDKLYPPYYFYLHSKMSDLFYRVDRRFGPRVPNLIATQWVVVASRVPETELPLPLIPVPNVVAQGALTSFAFAQALGVKAMELGLRALRRPSWESEGT